MHRVIDQLVSSRLDSIVQRPFQKGVGPGFHHRVKRNSFTTTKLDVNWAASWLVMKASLYVHCLFLCFCVVLVFDARCHELSL